MPCLGTRIYDRSPHVNKCIHQDICYRGINKGWGPIPTYPTHSKIEREYRIYYFVNLSSLFNPFFTQCDPYGYDISQRGIKYGWRACTGGGRMSGRNQMGIWGIHLHFICVCTIYFFLIWYCTVITPKGGIPYDTSRWWCAYLHIHSKIEQESTAQWCLLQNRAGDHFM